MTKQNIEWCVEQVTKWMDDEPWMSWGEVWEALADCLELERVDVLDKIKIKQAVRVTLDN